MKLGSSIRRRQRLPGHPAAVPERLWARLRGSVFWQKVSLGVGVALAGLVFGYVIATRLLFPVPEPPADLVAVPDLRGLEIPEASSTLESRGLRLGSLDSIRHPTMPEGRILGQSPLGGQLSRRDGEVRVAMSMGPDRRIIPGVRGFEGDRALAILEASGFSVVVDSVQSRQPRGQVLQLSPDAGTEVSLPAVVMLTLSIGPPTFEMPNLSGLPQEEALAVVDSLGLVVSDVATRFRFGLDQGIVLEQYPAAGALVTRGSAVRLVVGQSGRPGGNNGAPGP